jgi:regulator of sigma E protease
MSAYNSIIQLVVVISALIILHEVGHFLGARLFKIHSEEFGIGFPPRLARLFRLKGTIQIGSTVVKVPFGIKALQDLEVGMWVETVTEKDEEDQYKLKKIQLLPPVDYERTPKQEFSNDGIQIHGELTAVNLGTLFSFNWLPLGGFVKIRGEGDLSVPDGLAAGSPWKRVVVYAMGPIFNIALAVVLYAVIISQLGMADPSVVLIADVVDNSPAAVAGLQVDDVILDIDGQTVDSMIVLHDAIYAKLGAEIALTYQRADQVIESVIVPRENPPEGEGAIGIVMGNPTAPISWLAALPMGAVSTANHALALVTLPAQVVQGAISAEEARPVGYKGMYDIYQDVQERELVPGAPQSLNIIWFFTTITISLGVLNLLPIPALDGGRILFTLPEIIFRRRIPMQAQNFINAISFMLMILLFFYINYLDFANPVQLP